jgi:hypothetical protein
VLESTEDASKTAGLIISNLHEKKAKEENKLEWKNRIRKLEETRGEGVLTFWRTSQATERDNQKEKEKTSEPQEEGIFLASWAIGKLDLRSGEL